MEIARSSIAESVADEIIKRRKAELAKKITAYPRNYPYLSDIGECDRQMTYGVTHWQERALPDEDLQARFDAGNLQEREIIRELEGLGFKISLSQMPVEVRGRGGILLSRGKVDGFIEYEGHKIPFEVKSMNPNIFESIKDVSDFQKRPYLRKYIRQLQMYMFGNNVEQSIFILTDCLGHWKILPLYLSLEECEQILQRLERVHFHLAARTLPDRVPYDRDICGKCPFAVRCLPDILNKPAEMINNPQVEADITRHEELAPLSSEYKRLHEKLKDTFEGVEKAIVGESFIVMSLPTKRKSYKELSEEVEAEVKALNEKIEHVKKPFLKQSYELVIEPLNKKESAA